MLHQLSGREEEGRLTGSKAAGGAAPALGEEERLTGSQVAGGAAPALGEEHGLSDHGRARVEVSRLVSRPHRLLLPRRVICHINRLLTKKIEQVIDGHSDSS